MLKRWLAILAAYSLLCYPLAANTAIYTWTDASGKKHFSDEPPGDKKTKVSQVELKEITTLNFTRVTPLSPGMRKPRQNPGADQGEFEPPEVIMYSTVWCGACKKAKAWFNQKGIEFTEHDIERSEAALEEFRQYGGKGVPLILVGDYKMEGFSASRFWQLYRQE